MKVKYLKIIINELDFLKKAVIIQWITLKKIYCSSQAIYRKIPDPCNAKLSIIFPFLRKKNRKSLKQSEII